MAVGCMKCEGLGPDSEPNWFGALRSDDRDPAKRVFKLGFVDGEAGGGRFGNDRLIVGIGSVDDSGRDQIVPDFEAGQGVVESDGDRLQVFVVQELPDDFAGLFGDEEISCVVSRGEPDACRLLTDDKTVAVSADGPERGCRCLEDGEFQGVQNKSRVIVADSGERFTEQLGEV